MSFSNILLAGMMGLFMLSMGYVVIFVLYQRRMVSRDLEHQKLINQHQQSLLKSVIEGQEAERKRIAHDLHDEIGTMLATSKLYFNQLSPGYAEARLPMVQEKLNVLFDEMVSNIRRISHDLRPIVLENLGLIEAIESFRDKLESAQIDFSFDHQMPWKLQPSSELTLYRIIQELISNTVKHANASAIELRLSSEGDDLLLIYSDNGIGFQNITENGLGLRGIETRVNLLKGKLSRGTISRGVHFEIRINASSLKHA